MLAFLRWAGWARKASEIYLWASEKTVGESFPGLIAGIADITYPDNYQPTELCCQGTDDVEQLQLPTSLHSSDLTLLTIKSKLKTYLPQHCHSVLLPQWLRRQIHIFQVKWRQVILSSTIGRQYSETNLTDVRKRVNSLKNAAQFLSIFFSCWQSRHCHVKLTSQLEYSTNENSVAPAGAIDTKPRRRSVQFAAFGRSRNGIA